VRSCPPARITRTRRASRAPRGSSSPLAPERRSRPGVLLPAGGAEITEVDRSPAGRSTRARAMTPPARRPEGQRTVASDDLSAPALGCGTAPAPASDPVSPSWDRKSSWS
jgi:hypothetical protein